MPSGVVHMSDLDNGPRQRHTRDWLLYGTGVWRTVEVWNDVELVGVCSPECGFSGFSEPPACGLTAWLPTPPLATATFQWGGKRS